MLRLYMYILCRISYENVADFVFFLLCFFFCILLCKKEKSNLVYILRFCVYALEYLLCSRIYLCGTRSNKTTKKLVFFLRGVLGRSWSKHNGTLSYIEKSLFASKQRCLYSHKVVQVECLTNFRYYYSFASKKTTVYLYI